MTFSPSDQQKFLDFIRNTKLDVNALKPWERQALSGYLANIDRDDPPDMEVPPLTPADEVCESVRKLFFWVSQSNFERIGHWAGIVHKDLQAYDDWRAGERVNDVDTL